MRRYRKRYGRKKMKKSKGWGSTMKTVGQVAKTAFNIAKGVASVVNVEYKYFDKTTTLSPDTNGLVYHISNIPAGDDANQRNGRSIKVKSLYLRGQFAINPNYVTTSPVYPSYMRLLLIKDNENNGAVPAVSDILEAVDWNSPLKINNGSQFTVMKDKLISLDPNDQRSKIFKYFKKHSDHIKYKSTGSAITDSRNGQYFVMVLSNETSATQLPYFKFYSRIRFIDN